MDGSLLHAHLADLADSTLAPWAGLEPWSLVATAAETVRTLIETLDGDFVLTRGVAVHRTATVESGALVKPPAIVGPGCFVAAGATLRGGVWLEQSCTLGPGVELKSSFLFRDTRLAHFNFVGDSILGADVNLEAGRCCRHALQRRRHCSLPGHS